MIKYRGWFGNKAKRYCPHSRIVEIDVLNVDYWGVWDLECLDCGQYLDGPPELASMRTRERELIQ